MEKVRARNSRAVADGAADDYVAEFREWIADALRRDDRARLVRWRELAPHASRAHPTPEHLLPLFVAFGAASGADGPPPRVERLEAGVDSGVLAMDAYVFSPLVRQATYS